MDPANDVGAPVKGRLTTAGPEHRIDVRMACAILAGGKASRYGGVAKGLLPLSDGTTIIGRLLAELAAAGMLDTVIVTNEPETYRSCDRHSIRDLRPGMGPLGGIEAALNHFRGTHGSVLVLPCDLPDISRDEIAALRDAHLTVKAPVTIAQTSDGRWHPLCAILHRDIGPAITAALDQDIRSVRRVWQQAGPCIVRFNDDRPFLNVNSPEDMATWRRDPIHTRRPKDAQEQCKCCG